MNSTQNLYQRLGIAPLINAAGHETSLSGSLMPPEVLDAVFQAAQHYVPLRELQIATGKRVAEVIGAPAALITTGASGAILLATAACLTGTDYEKALRLPNVPPGSRHEVLVWRMARPNYLYPPCEAAGGTLVELDGSDGRITPEDFRDTMGPHTAAILLMVHALDEARDRTGGWQQLIGGVARYANDRGIPVLVDAAAELPPRALVRQLFEIGVAAVMISGGKAIRGPQSSGILAARPELIEAALLHNAPDRMIGRPLKVGKEELCGLTVAAERFWEINETEQLAQWRQCCERIARASHGVAGAKAEVVEGVPGYGRPPLVPKVVVHLAGEWTAETVASRLRVPEGGLPGIQVLRRGGALLFNPMALETGEAEVVAERLARLLAAQTETPALSS
jgi:seryl-tRNA(Sec) selenium transferase